MKLKIGFFLLIIGSISCRIDDFGDINFDRNNSTNPDTGELLTDALVQLSNTRFGYDGQEAHAYVQYLTGHQYNSDVVNYEHERFDYHQIYARPLMNIQFIIDYNTDPTTMESMSKFGSNTNQIAVSNILKMHFFLHITDRWGDIPYSEALSTGILREIILNPKFDVQEEIYEGENGIFSVLQKALNEMEDTDPPEGDILFYGNMDMWRVFANTLRLTAALRISNVDPSRGRVEFNSALNDGVINRNQENIVFQHLSDNANRNPLTWTYSILKPPVANTLIDYMNHASSINPFTGQIGKMDILMDPRLPEYASPTSVSGGTEYIGKPYGLTEAESGNIPDSEVSLLQDDFKQRDFAYPIYTYAQVLFCRAEAALLGWTTEDAEKLYYEAIRASLEQYGVEEEYDLFITNSEVTWDPARAFEKIGTQKWVAMFLQGYESWSNWRRTGYPVLVPSPYGIKSNTIPTRQAYPFTELELNKENWQEAVDRQFGGEDNLNGKVWWDKD